MNIGEAVVALKNGKIVTRTNGWHGNHFLIYVRPDDPIIIIEDGSMFESSDPEEYGVTRGINPFVGIIAANDPENVTPWVCNSTDLLAEDWEEVSALPAYGWSSDSSRSDLMDRHTVLFDPGELLKILFGQHAGPMFDTEGNEVQLELTTTIEPKLVSIDFNSEADNVIRITFDQAE